MAPPLARPYPFFLPDLPGVKENFCVEPCTGVKEIPFEDFFNRTDTVVGAAAGAPVAAVLTDPICIATPV